MLLSLIIPTYNSEKTLRAALDSISNQKFDDWEVIVVDGVSSDETLSIVKQYSQRERRIRWISEPDEGIYDAMNKGVQMAQGEWVYFLGSDDWLYDERTLNKIFYNNAKLTDDVELIRCRVMRKDKISDIQNVQPEYVIFENLNHQSIIIKRSVMLEIPYEQHYKMAGDLVQFIKMIGRGVVSIPCDQVLANYSSGGYSSYGVDINWSREKEQILRECFVNSIEDKMIYQSMRLVAFTQIKYDNPLKGLLWLYKGGLIKERWRDVLYCFKVRFYRSILGSKKFK